MHKIYANSGIMPNDTAGFNFFFDCIEIEHDPFNFTFPDWLDEKTFNESQEFVETTADFITGGFEKWNLKKNIIRRNFSWIWTTS